MPPCNFEDSEARESHDSFERIRNRNLQSRSSHVRRSQRLNVAATTYPLDPNASTTGFDQPECLNGVELENLSSAASSYYELPVDVLPSKAMRLVDPKRQARIVHSNDPSDTIRKGKP